MNERFSRVVWALATATALSAGACTEPTDEELDQSRIKLVNAPVPVRDDDAATGAVSGLKPQTLEAEGGGAFVYVASVDAPMFNGKTVQATNFAFDGDTAYVVYNTAGPEIRGGIDVLDLSKLSQPKLVASIVSEEQEFADIALRGNFAYAVGATPRGATLKVFDIAKKSKVVEVGSLDLPAHYATSISLETANDAWVTTGTNGGLVHVDVSNPRQPKIETSYAIPNALYVLPMQGAHLVLGGDALAVHREKDGDLAAVAPVSPAFVEAPGRLAQRDHRLFTNAGLTGLTQMDVSADGRDVTVTGHSSLAGTGNGIDASSAHLFLAQGEAGTLLYDFHGNDPPAYVGKFDFPDDRGSANQVRAGKCGGKPNVFVGDGLGGFRIIQFDE